jgi:hypothetical protein
MFETGTMTAEYGQGEYGRRRRRRDRWADQSEGGYAPGEFGLGEAEYGPGEYGQGEYGQGEYAEYEQGEYGLSELEAGEGEERFLPFIPLIGKVLGGLLGGLGKEAEAEYAGEYGQGEYDEGEFGDGEYAQGEFGDGEYGQGEYGQGEYGQGEYGQGEYGQGEYGQGEEEQGEAGEAEEQFLGKILSKVLGNEAEYNETGLSPAQEAEFAAQFMEISNEQEVEQFLGGIVNAVGRAVQGIRGAVNSPQGRALIDAVKPLARAALPSVAGAIGGAIVPGVGARVGRTLGTAASALFETETSGLGYEQEQYEIARRLVRLTAAAARDVATAPPGAPPELVGELGVIRAARRHARPLFRRAVRRITPFARRFFRGGRHTGFLRGHARRYRPGYRGYRTPYYRRGLRPYGYPAAVVEPPPVEPAPEPSQPPAQPGFRWVAVPIGAPAPGVAVPAEQPPGADSKEPPAPGQSEFAPNGYGQYGGGRFSGRWVRRDGKIILLGA